MVQPRQCRIQTFFGEADFSTSVAKKKTTSQLGGLGGGCCKSSPVESRGEVPENFGYLAFCVAENIVFVAVCDNKQ